MQETGVYSFQVMIEPKTGGKWADHVFVSEVIAGDSDEATDFFQIWLSDHDVFIDDDDFSVNVSRLGGGYFDDDIGVVQGVHVRNSQGIRMGFRAWRISDTDGFVDPSKLVKKAGVDMRGITCIRCRGRVDDDGFIRPGLQMMDDRWEEGFLCPDCHSAVTDAIQNRTHQTKPVDKISGKC